MEEVIADGEGDHQDLPLVYFGRTRTRPTGMTMSSCHRITLHLKRSPDSGCGLLKNDLMSVGCAIDGSFRQEHRQGDDGHSDTTQLLSDLLQE